MNFFVEIDTKIFPKGSLQLFQKHRVAPVGTKIFTIISYLWLCLRYCASAKCN